MRGATSSSTASSSRGTTRRRGAEVEAYRFGDEWDFLYRDRGFVGIVLEAKYTESKRR